MKFKLRDYQEKVKLDVKEFLEKSNFTKGLIVMPVGSGKALCTSIIAEQVKGNVLVLQPSKELLEQNYEKAMGFGLKASIYSASIGVKEVGNITFATPMSVVKKVNEFKNVEVVVIDEAHLHSSQDLNGRKSKMGEFIDAIKPRKIIGLTATPIQLVSGNRQSELKMMVRSKRSFWYGADIFHITQIQDIANTYWAKLSYEQHGVDESKLQLNSSGTDFVMESIIDMYEYNNLDQEIIDVYTELRKQGKKSILIFVPTVDIALDLASKHPDFHVVYGDMDKNRRQQILDDFKSGKINCVLNVQVLSTGYDHPELDAIIMARSTNSFALYLQIVGRLVRPILKDGKIIRKEGKIVDLTKNVERFGHIENITFEKQDYTKGWAMWNGDKLLTGLPFGNWNTPTREQMIAQYDKYIASKNKTKQQLTQDEFHQSRVNAETLQTGHETVFHFGKFKGKKFTEVWGIDKANGPGRQYITWLLSYRDFNWNTNYMRKFKNTLEEFVLQMAMEGF